MTSKPVSRQSLFLGFAALIYAMILLFCLISNFNGRSAEHWRFFYAFTQQSNILVLVWLILFGISCFAPLPALRFVYNKTLITALTVYISITFFIVAFILSPIYTGQWQPLSSTNEFLLHNMTPIVMWFYFFLVPGQGSLKSKHALLVLIYPIIYVAANLIIGANVTYISGDKAYAYGFINPGIYPNLFIFGLVIIALIAIFATFGLLLIKLKNKIDKTV